MKQHFFLIVITAVFRTVTAVNIQGIDDYCFVRSLRTVWLVLCLFLHVNCFFQNSYFKYLFLRLFYFKFCVSLANIDSTIDNIFWYIFYTPLCLKQRLIKWSLISRAGFRICFGGFENRESFLFGICKGSFQNLIVVWIFVWFRFRFVVVILWKRVILSTLIFVLYDYQNEAVYRDNIMQVKTILVF